VRVATFQKTNPGFDLERNLLEVLNSLEQVKNANLVRFPECYLTGYTIAFAAVIFSQSDITIRIHC
jgi:predicted amidohydrolase